MIFRLQLANNNSHLIIFSQIHMLVFGFVLFQNDQKCSLDTLSEFTMKTGRSALRCELKWAPLSSNSLQRLYDFQRTFSFNDKLLRIMKNTCNELTSFTIIFKWIKWLFCWRTQQRCIAMGTVCSLNELYCMEHWPHKKSIFLLSVQKYGRDMILFWSSVRHCLSSH